MPRKQTPSEILSKFFATEYISKADGTRSRISSFDHTLSVQLKDPSTAARKYIKKVNSLGIRKEAALKIFNNICYGLAFGSALLTSDMKGLFSNFDSINEALSSLMLQIETFSLALGDYRKAFTGELKPRLDFAFLKTCLETLEKLQAKFTERFGFFWGNQKMLALEKPSGQHKAIPESLRESVRASLKVLIEDLKVKEPVKPWRDSERGGQELQAAKMVYELYKCFDIDLKSADNVRKIDYRR